MIHFIWLQDLKMKCSIDTICRKARIFDIEIYFRVLSWNLVSSKITKIFREDMYNLYSINWESQFETILCEYEKHTFNSHFKTWKDFISDPIKPVSTAENSLMDTIRQRQENSKLMKLYKLKNGLQKRYLGLLPWNTISYQ